MQRSEQHPLPASSHGFAKRVLALAVSLASFMLMAGCAVGPDFEKPAAPGTDSYTEQPFPAQTASADVKGGEAQRFMQDRDIPGQWWTLFHSQPLNDLIQQSFKANPDLTAAQAALREAWENVYAQQGAYSPSVDANFNPTRQQTAAVLSSPLNSGSNIFNLHTAQVTVGYVPDIFGNTRRQVESLKAQADAQRFQLEATYVTLASNVVAAAVQEASLRGQMTAAKRIIEIQTQSLALMQRRYELGQIASADIAGQEAALAQSQSMLPPLEKQLAQQRDLLARLVGRNPGETLAQTFELSSLQLPQELPVLLPARLVEKRPDVRMAEEQWHAASAEIGVAISNRLPNISLSADLSSSATAIGQLFTSGTGGWALGANVTQPVFQGGTLLHRQRAAVAAYDQAAAQYRSTVLTALQNVADTLHAIQSDADALKAAVKAERAAAKSLAIVRRQLELGDISSLELLNAEQTYQQAMINLVQALANRYADTAALFQALGGGWWNLQDGDKPDAGIPDNVGLQ